MKRRLLPGLLICCALAQACHKNPSPAQPVHKTVQTVEYSDRDIGRLMDQWRQDGWIVLSMSKVTAAPDGTRQRTVELERARGK
jgi:hypothetical protein